MSGVLIYMIYYTGIDWHVHIINQHNHFIHGDLPKFIMDSYEDCREPPRLHMLDKYDHYTFVLKYKFSYMFDIVDIMHYVTRFSLSFRFDSNGPGSCLKKYSDPTFFKRASPISDEAAEKAEKDRKRLRRKVICFSLSFKFGQLNVFVIRDKANVI